MLRRMPNLQCSECGLTNNLLRELLAWQLRCEYLERELSRAVVFGKAHVDALDGCLRSLATSMTRDHPSDASSHAG